MKNFKSISFILTNFLSFLCSGVHTFLMPVEGYKKKNNLIIFNMKNHSVDTYSEHFIYILPVGYSLAYVCMCV